MRPSSTICAMTSFSSPSMAGMPTSIWCTPTSFSSLAMRIFSWLEKTTPAVCSPSRSVVSSMRTGGPSAGASSTMTKLERSAWSEVSHARTPGSPSDGPRRRHRDRTNMQAVGMRQAAPRTLHRARGQKSASLFHRAVTSGNHRQPDSAALHELAHELGVRLALRGLHDLADEEAGELLLAGPELLDLGRMRGQHRRDDGFELGSSRRPGRDRAGGRCRAVRRVPRP